MSFKEFLTLHRDSTMQVKTLCERELSALILVAPVLLFDSPCIILSEACKCILFKFTLISQVPNILLPNWKK